MLHETSICNMINMPIVSSNALGEISMIHIKMTTTTVEVGATSSPIYEGGLKIMSD